MERAHSSCTNESSRSRTIVLKWAFHCLPQEWQSQRKYLRMPPPHFHAQLPKDHSKASVITTILQLLRLSVRILDNLIALIATRPIRTIVPILAAGRPSIGSHGALHGFERCVDFVERREDGRVGLGLFVIGAGLAGERGGNSVLVFLPVDLRRRFVLVARMCLGFVGIACSCQEKHHWEPTAVGTASAALLSHV